MSDLGTRRTPYSIPNGTEPYPEDRMSWAQEQIPYLNLQDVTVLTFLARHAWGRDRESDSYPLGYVRTEWASGRRLADVMNKRYATIHAILTRLREAGYISVARDPSKGPGAPSAIRIWWYESADVMRERLRAGEIDLPEAFREVILDA